MLLKGKILPEPKILPSKNVLRKLSAESPFGGCFRRNCGKGEIKVLFLLLRGTPVLHSRGWWS